MIKSFFKIVVPLAILAVGIFAGAWFFANPDEAQKRPRPEAQALLVETAYGEQGIYRAKVEAMGQVHAALSVALKPQVPGEIVSVAPEFVPGGFFKSGEEILTIDPADYELAVRKQQAVLRQAQAAYDLEMGRQSVARDELKIIERTTGHKPENPELALRGPQLSQAKAEREKAQADLDAAKLDLLRTKLTAPFNALVTQREATLGDKVSASQTLARLVNTDEYWLELSVPVADLRWLELPRGADEAGSAAKIILDGGRGERDGHLVRLTGALDTGSRLATLLVSVPDPLLRNDGADKDAPQLILGDYAKVVIDGKILQDVVRLPRVWVRDGNTVWVKEGERLFFRDIEILYQDREYAYVASGLAAGDSVVTSDIAVPVNGMKVRDATEARAAMQERMIGPKGPEDSGRE